MQNTFCEVTTSVSFRCGSSLQAKTAIWFSSKKPNPGVIDQHVYSLKEMDHLEEVVEEKIVSHLLS